MPSPAAPDPARGLFETLLVADGRAVRAAAHLDRLEASAYEVFGQALPTDLPAAIDAAAAPLDLGRMRIDLLPDGDAASPTLRFEIAAAPIDPAIFFPARADGADVRTVRHPGWAGAHKWGDRDWLEAREAELGEVVPVILSADDEVLEAGRANLFIVTDGALATPPVDGRILPGTARATTLELSAELGIPATERPLHLADLQEADDLFLTSSLRGIRPVRSLDGLPLDRSDRLVERLADALRARWLDEGPAR
jgi:para-aminobenzoate synthetase / 4-amino-4-deoxychorismate lyase